MLLILACTSGPDARELPSSSGRPDDEHAADDTAASPDTGSDTAEPPEEAPPLDCSGAVVNGYSVAEPACSWLDHTGRSVVPQLAGSRDEQLDLAAIVAWWSLKEGVYFLDNPLVYSNCGASGYIGALEVCPDGYAWQVGLSGVQVPTFSESTATSTAETLFPDLSVDEVLREAAELAGLAGADIDAVVASSGDLRTSWLLRTSAVGFTLQVEIIERECIDAAYSWCFGTGWSSTSRYAPDQDAAMGAIEDIRVLLEQVAP